ncbi:MAG: sulfite exporter TauE/SafE family protein [Actinobacteria bacterium]|nr:sulfite exporter TauE/SafE family protein [Actinomycetota bacterium]
MDAGTVALIAIAVAAGGVVQGLSGLGFALVSAPVVSQIVPGTAGIGLVNALSIVQNVWLIARTDARLAWREIRRMVPGLVMGVALGWLVLRVSSPALFDVIVAVSACASVAWLLLAGRFRGPLAGFLSAAWGGTVNTVAGVGGPPIAAYLVTRGLDLGSYVKTLQVVFATLSLVSLPLLGVYVPSVGAAAVWVGALIAGSVGGELARRRFNEATTQRIAKVAIIVVCAGALARSLWLLPGHLS